MKQLLELIRVMTPKEIHSTRSIFKEAPRFAKRSQLFEIALKGEMEDDQQVCLTLYKKTPNSAFSHLKSRLLRQLHQIVLPSLEAASLNGSSPTRQVVWQALILGQFFLDRGAPAQAKEIAHEGKKKALEAQLSTEILLLENLCLRAQSSLPDSEGHKTSVNISDYAMLLGRQIEARKNFQDLDHVLRMGNPKIESLSPTLAQAIVEIPGMLEEPLPPEIRFWSLMSLIRYLTLIEDLPQALNRCQNLLETLKKHEDQFTTYHHDLAQLAWAKLNFEAGEDGRAKATLRIVLDSQENNPRIQMEALETDFSIAFYSGESALASQRLKEAQALTKGDTNSFAHAKWTFYAANVSFLNRDFPQVLELLRSCSQLLKSKSKWLPGIKILEIFTLLELEELELAEYRLEALRQLLKRQKQCDIRRARVICKVIGAYMRQGYSPQRILKDCEGLLHSHWRPFNFEVLSLELWLKTLLKKPRLSPSLKQTG